MSIAKGDYVVAPAKGSGPLAQGYGYVGYNAGEELVVTSVVNSTLLNVRRTRGGRVFRMSVDKVRAVTRPLGQVPEGGIEADDPRIAWIFEDAGRLADRFDYCREFDRIAEALGAPGRIRTFSIKLEVAEGMEITAKVEARSRKLAEKRVIEQVRASQTLAIGA